MWRYRGFCNKRRERSLPFCYWEVPPGAAEGCAGGKINPHIIPAVRRTEEEKQGMCGEQNWLCRVRSSAPCRTGAWHKLAQKPRIVVVGRGFVLFLWRSCGVMIWWAVGSPWRPLIHPGAKGGALGALWSALDYSRGYLEASNAS